MNILPPKLSLFFLIIGDTKKIIPYFQFVLYYFQAKLIHFFNKLMESNCLTFHQIHELTNHSYKRLELVRTENLSIFKYKKVLKTLNFEILNKEKLVCEKISLLWSMVELFLPYQKSKLVLDSSYRILELVLIQNRIIGPIALIASSSALIFI